MNCLKCGKPAHLCGGVWRCERCGDLAVALCASGQKGAQPSRLSDGTPEGQGETSERVFHDCRVQFSEGGWAYSYLLNDPLPQIGDAVVVPFGKKNLEKVGIIVSIGDHLQNNLPYPLEKTKMVIRKAAPSDILAERESTPPAQPVEKEVAVKKNEKQDALAGAISAVSDKLKTVYKKVEPPDEQAVKSGAPAEQPAEQNTTAAAEQGEPDKADSRPVAEEQRSRRRFSFRKLAVSVAVLLLLGGGLVYFSISAHYMRAQRHIGQEEYALAVEDLKSVPEAYRERQVLAQYALICAQAQKGGAEELQAAVDTLEDLIEQSPENLQSEMRAQYEAFCRQYDALLYELGIQALEARDYSAAVSHLRKVSDMPHTRELFIYAVACWRTRPDGTAVMLKDALNRLNTVSPDYDGPYAEEIAALRSDLPRQITAAEAREKAAREKARKADEKWIAALEATGLPYVGMAESEIHTTRQLGRAGYSGTDYEYQADAAGKYHRVEWRVYAWYDQNGGKVFMAECRNGTVFRVEKCNADAWDGDRLLVSLGPFRLKMFNSGNVSEETGGSLQDEYGWPEDLYEEDGTYTDLDEAIDEWAEG